VRIAHPLTCPNANPPFVELFSREVVETLYSYKMLDEVFAPPDYGWFTRPLPEFYPSYVQYRVKNEPENGHPGLVTIRKVVDHLRDEATPSSRDIMLEALCNLLLELDSNVFKLPPRSYSETSEDKFEVHLVCAAVYFGKISIVKKWLEENNYRISTPYSWIFGFSAELAQRYGNMDMVTLFLRDAQGHVDASRRTDFFEAACSYGREDIFEEIFNFQIGQTPWRLSSSRGWGSIRLLYRASCTPSIQIWLFLSDLHKQYSLKKDWPQRVLDYVLADCVRQGRVKMFRHLLHNGASPDAKLMAKACSFGHIEIVKMLLRLNIRHDDAMKIAAGKGYSAIVDLLLENNASNTGALEEAAHYGRRDMVQLLLDRGVRFDSQESLNSAIERVASLEHKPLIDILSYWRFR
jgi:hypothetical protein